MARDPPKVPRKKDKREIPPPTGTTPSEESSDDEMTIPDALERENRYEEHQRRLEAEQRCVCLLMF